jgi:hypothetical protein
VLDLCHQRVRRSLAASEVELVQTAIFIGSPKFGGQPPRLCHRVRKMSQPLHKFNVSRQWLQCCTSIPLQSPRRNETGQSKQGRARAEQSVINFSRLSELSRNLTRALLCSTRFLSSELVCKIFVAIMVGSLLRRCTVHVIQRLQSELFRWYQWRLTCVQLLYHSSSPQNHSKLEATPLVQAIAEP